MPNVSRALEEAIENTGKLKKEFTLADGGRTPGCGSHRRLAWGRGVAGSETGLRRVPGPADRGILPGGHLQGAGRPGADGRRACASAATWSEAAPTTRR